MRRESTAARGFVAVELSASIALLLLPVAMLVVSLPSWSGREHAATVIAREVARLSAQRWPVAADGEVDDLVRELATNLGIDADDVVVSVNEQVDRGERMRATVTIRMPAISVPGIGTVGQWHWTTSNAVRIDAYRSR